MGFVLLIIKGGFFRWYLFSMWVELSYSWDFRIIVYSIIVYDKVVVVIVY